MLHTLPRYVTCKNVSARDVRVTHPKLPGGYIDIPAGAEAQIPREVWPLAWRRSTGALRSVDSPAAPAPEPAPEPEPEAPAAAPKRAKKPKKE